MNVHAGTDGAVAAGAGGPVAGRSRAISPEEFARLFQEQWRVLWCAAAAVVGDRTAAQDIVQQAAVVALERLDRFEAGTSFTGWMVQIVRNIALNESRKRGRRRTSLADGQTLDASGAGGAPARVAGVVTGRGQIAAGAEPFDDELRRALGTLDETARACLLMRVVLEMPYRQISLALGVPEGTAASHVHRARAALRDELRPRGAGATGGGAGGDGVVGGVGGVGGAGPSSKGTAA